jgi:hypothetical protein
MKLHNEEQIHLSRKTERVSQATQDSRGMHKTPGKQKVNNFSLNFQRGEAT